MACTESRTGIQVLTEYAPKVRIELVEMHSSPGKVTETVKTRIWGMQSAAEAPGAGKKIVISGANCLAVCSAFSSQLKATTGAAAVSS